MENLKKLIESIVREVINEGRYDGSITPLNTRSNVRKHLGDNPLFADNGGHSNQDVVSQVSTFDNNGANFISDKNIVVPDNKLIIYKIKNFGNDSIESTLNLFGSGAAGEKELRRAIDTLNGGARRNGKSVIYRTITSEAFEKISKRTGHMSKTFWEFSLDGGNTWNILKPKPIENLQPSKLVLRTNEDIIRLTEAKDGEFSFQTLSSLPNFSQRLKYCDQHLGIRIGNGSSRVVYQYNDQLCVKLAKNNAGIAQNDNEVDYYKEELDCFPKVYDNDPDGKWLLAEYVLPAKEEDFKQCLGISWNDFVMFIAKAASMYTRRVTLPKMDDNRLNELIENNRTLYDIYDYMLNYNAPYGDLTVLHNYGMVRRYNENKIVILDSGLTDEVWDEFYKR